MQEIKHEQQEEPSGEDRAVVRLTLESGILCSPSFGKSQIGNMHFVFLTDGPESSPNCRRLPQDLRITELEPCANPVIASGVPCARRAHAKMDMCNPSPTGRRRINGMLHAKGLTHIHHR